MTTPAYEVNFETFPAMTMENPKKAALELLNKMKLLDSIGIKQALLPPQERPYLSFLKRVGFDGRPQELLTSAKRSAAWLIPEVSLATNQCNAKVCPSIDSADLHIHFTPANQGPSLIASIEAEAASLLLKATFNNPIFFEVHPSLPNVELFYDEGAKNHFRFCKNYGSPGIQLFTFEKSYQPSKTLLPSPEKRPIRQSKEAAEAISRLHRLYPGHQVFAFQNPNVLESLAISNQYVLLIHSRAFWKQGDVLKELKKCVSDICGTELKVIEITENQLSVNEAVNTLFFQSQIVTLSDHSMALIVPESCKHLENGFLRELLEDNNNPIGSLHFACASRPLKVVMNAAELSEIAESILFKESLYYQLVSHVSQYYPTEVTTEDYLEPKFYQKSVESLNEISRILNLRDIYSFQRP